MDRKRHERCTGLVVDHLLFHTDLQFSSNQTHIYMWPLHLDPFTLESRTGGEGASFSAPSRTTSPPVLTLPTLIEKTQETHLENSCCLLPTKKCQKFRSSSQLFPFQHAKNPADKNLIPPAMNGIVTIAMATLFFSRIFVLKTEVASTEAASP